MFWDKISPLYDLFENIYNHKVYAGTGEKVAELIEPSDHVLECACGTGAITVCIAGKCNRLVAQSLSAGMAVKFVEALGADFKKNLDKLGRLRLGCRMLMD